MSLILADQSPRASSPHRQAPSFDHGHTEGQVKWSTRNDVVFHPPGSYPDPRRTQTPTLFQPHSYQQVLAVCPLRRPSCVRCGIHQ